MRTTSCKRMNRVGAPSSQQLHWLHARPRVAHRVVAIPVRLPSQSESACSQGARLLGRPGRRRETSRTSPCTATRSTSPATSARLVVTGPLVAVSKTSGHVLVSFPELSEDGYVEMLEAPVRTLVADGSGGWFIGGSFTHADDRPCAGLLHVTRAGRIDSRFCRRINRAVRALFLLEDTLYVGGSFTKIGKQERHGLAAFSARTGELLQWAPVLGPATRKEFHGNPASIATANVIVGSDEVLYVGGFFGTVDHEPRRHLAAIAGGRRASCRSIPASTIPRCSTTCSMSVASRLLR